LIKLKYSKLLNLYNFRTGIETNGIKFTRIPWSPSHTGYKRINSISAFREGFVFIQPENNKLKVKWSIKLDTLYLKAFIIGVFAGLLSIIFFDLNLSFSIIIGLFGSLISIVFGRWTIVCKIIEINITCLEE
jgi:hypothetical protein